MDSRPRKENCWEYMQCGREPGGHRVDELGVCAAATDRRFDGVNGGKNAGRCCWGVAGTLCNGKGDGVFVEKFGNCVKCPFYLDVERHEGRFFELFPGHPLGVLGVLEQPRRKK